MDLTIIGAGGDVGREITRTLIAERLLQNDETLLLVGNPEGPSRKALHGFAVDLMDAYAETCPRITLSFDPGEIRGDIVVMTAGATLTPEPNGKDISRDTLAEKNVPVFEQYAEALAKHGHGSEIVLCVSNPNELAVAVFAGRLGRKRVIGTGAFLDSLRFRKEIAADLGIRRQQIHGFMVGEHGRHLVPLWSNVHIYRYSGEALSAAIRKIRKNHRTPDFPGDVLDITRKLRERVLTGRIQEAYAILGRYPPDIRAAVKPFITHFSGSKTIMGTARATMDLIRTIMLGSDALISGQISLEGEFYGIHSTIGVPFVIGNQGVDRIIQPHLDPEEKTLLCESAERVGEKIRRFIG
ncbi:MAG TPA: malate dehydrogenase [bacterium]|nr:malate dehydrogenase [bacterium]